MEARVLAVRAEHPAWGGRKLRRRLHDLGEKGVPAASTCTAILRRHGCLDPAETPKHTAWQRFEHPAPNDLWQMDFKGEVALADGLCHPLMILDDHSRFALGLVACPDEQASTVQAALTAIFRRYGLPWRLLSDNGPPWGTPLGPLTILTVWLVRLGIAVSHGRVRHPQTQGKTERYGRTLGAEVLTRTDLRDLAQAQAAFDRWRDVYNLERPHEALELTTPASRYQVSPRPFPEVLPPLVYEPGDAVRLVQASGTVDFQGRTWFVSEALRGQPVAVRPTITDGVVEVYFGHQRVRLLDLRQPDED